MSESLYRALPSVSDVLSTAPLSEVAVAQSVRVDAARLAIAEARRMVRDQQEKPDLHRIATDAARRANEAVTPSLREVINATGVIVHTNLGRAPLAAESLLAAMGTCNLEMDLDEGRRGSRRSHVERLLRDMSGAEAALVVNNNAAAVMLMLAGLAGGREVLISRSELVEIGGSFRIPDMMRAAGTKLVEVGTTNRTHLRDFEQGIGPETAAILRVHRSNFRISGFT